MDATTSPTHRVSLNNDHIDTTQDGVAAAMGTLHERHGGVPRVEVINGRVVAPGDACQGCGATHGVHVVGCYAEPPPVLKPVTSASTPVRGQTVDIVGALRSESDLQAARAAGFAPARPLFTRGTMVIDIGVENARTARLEFDAKPTVVDACSDLIGQVKREGRMDKTVNVSDIRMQADGRLTKAGENDKGILLTERCFSGLITRMQLPGGAGSYLAGCPSDLRAGNINRWAQQIGQEDIAATRLAVQSGATFKPVEAKLRIRGTNGSREIFAVVSPTYTPFDIDMIAEAVRRAVPAGARGTIAYDGFKSRIEVLFHTTTQPEHFVAGEFFRAGAIITTDDTGSGAVIVRAVLWMNMCKNMIVIDEAGQETARIRHVGSVEKLAHSFRKGFAAALKKIDHFVKSWDRACEDVIDVSSVVPIEADEVPTVREMLIAGTINGILNQQLVPVAGKKADAVPAILKAWKSDDSGAGNAHDGMNRAALANAFTRYAHETAAKSDPWIEDEIQAAAGALVQPGKSGKLAPLPFLAWDGNL